MPRSIRIEFAGAVYHVMARGNRRGAIFLDDEDRRMFLKTLGEACQMTGWRLPAWVLMENHYHLMLETPEPNLVEGMKWLQNTYTRRFNTRHRQWGRLFGDRYKAVPVEGVGYYYETLMDYIHLNPARAGLIRLEQEKGLLEYPWSSVAAGYARPPKMRPPWLDVKGGLGAFGFPDTVAGRRGFVQRLHNRMVAENLEKAGLPVLDAEVDRRSSRLDRGWYWGSQEFAERLLKLGQKILQRERHWTYRGSEEVQAHGESEAQRLCEEGLRLAGLKEQELASLPGSDPRKVALAALVWSRTTVDMNWLSQRLKMRSAGNARQQIWLSKNDPNWKSRSKTLPKKFKEWLKK